MKAYVYKKASKRPASACFCVKASVCKGFCVSKVLCVKASVFVQVSVSKAPVCKGACV